MRRPTPTIRLIVCQKKARLEMNILKMIVSRFSGDAGSANDENKPVLCNENEEMTGMPDIKQQW